MEEEIMRTRWMLSALELFIQSQLLIVQQLYWSAPAAITQYHRLCGRVWKVKIKEPHGGFPVRPHFLACGCHLVVSSVAFPWCVSLWFLSLFLKGHPSYWIMTPPLRPHLTLITPLKTLCPNRHSAGSGFNIYTLRGHISVCAASYVSAPIVNAGHTLGYERTVLFFSVPEEGGKLCINYNMEINYVIC